MDMKKDFKFSKKKIDEDEIDFEDYSHRKKFHKHKHEKSKRFVWDEE